jgi:tRNA(fMet)-specific endonuclease VapC
MDSARRNGRPISAADAWVAATALHLDVPLVTHNKSDFLGVDLLTVISES